MAAVCLFSTYGAVGAGAEEAEKIADEYISRGEAVRLICVLGLVKLQTPETGFSDVAENHLMYDYIQTMKFYGVAEGDGKGNFYPDRPIKNEEMVKMLVCLLGYGPMAFMRGGYPAGYTAVGTQIGVTRGLQLNVNSPAKREDVVEMIKNSLDIPVMRQVTTEEGTTFVIMDGISYERVTLGEPFEYYDTSRENISEMSKRFASRYDYKVGDTEKSFELYPDIVYTSGIEKRKDGTEYECPAIYDDLMAMEEINNITKDSLTLIRKDSLEVEGIDYLTFKGKMLVPVNVFRQMDCDTQIDKSAYVATISKGETTLEIMPNLIGMRKNKAEGYWVPLEACARVRFSTIFVPLEAVAKELGIELEWDDAEKTLTVSESEEYYIDVTFKKYSGTSLSYDMTVNTNCPKLYCDVFYPDGTKRGVTTPYFNTSSLANGIYCDDASYNDYDGEYLMVFYYEDCRTEVVFTIENSEKYRQWYDRVVMGKAE